MSLPKPLLLGQLLLGTGVKGGEGEGWGLERGGRGGEAERVV